MSGIIKREGNKPIKIPVSMGVVGGLSGYFLFSPFAMYISHIVHTDMPVHEMSVWEVFKPELLMWSIPFTLFGGAIGLVLGLLYHNVRERAAEVRESRDYIKLVLNSMGEGMVTINKDLRIVSVNRAYLDQVGGTEEEVVGEPCYRISHKLDKPCYEVGEDCPVKEVFDTGEPAAYVHIHHDKDGGEIHVKLNAYPIEDPEEGATQVLKISEDITQRIRAEEDFRNYVFEVADGLRNPLQIFKGFLEDFDTSNFNEEQKMRFRHILKASEITEENIKRLTRR